MVKQAERQGLRPQTSAEEKAAFRFGRFAGLKHGSGIVFLSLLLILCFSTLVFAAEGLSQKHVHDLAGLFGSETEALESQAEELAAAYGQKVFLVTSSNTEGKNSRNYAADFYDQAFPDGDSGIILLLDMQNRQMMLVTTGHAIDVIRDIDEESVYDAGESAMRNGDYALAAKRMLKRLQELFERGVAAGQYREKETEPNRLSLTEGLLSAGGALAAGGGLYGSTKKRYRGTMKPVPYAFAANRLMQMAPGEDQLIDQQITHLPLPKPVSSNSGGTSSGRSSTWTGSSGSTHGGGGGRGF